MGNRNNKQHRPLAGQLINSKDPQLPVTVVTHAAAASPATKDTPIQPEEELSPEKVPGVMDGALAGGKSRTPPTDEPRTRAKHVSNRREAQPPKKIVVEVVQNSEKASTACPESSDKVHSVIKNESILVGGKQANDEGPEKTVENLNGMRSKRIPQTIENNFTIPERKNISKEMSVMKLTSTSPVAKQNVAKTSKQITLKPSAEKTIPEKPEETVPPPTDIKPVEEQLVRKSPSTKPVNADKAPPAPQCVVEPGNTIAPKKAPTEAISSPEADNRQTPSRNVIKKQRTGTVGSAERKSERGGKVQSLVNLFDPKSEKVKTKEITGTPESRGQAKLNTQPDSGAATKKVSNTPRKTTGRIRIMKNPVRAPKFGSAGPKQEPPRGPSRKAGKKKTKKMIEPKKPSSVRNNPRLESILPKTLNRQRQDMKTVKSLDDPKTTKMNEGNEKIILCKMITPNDQEQSRFSRDLLSSESTKNSSRLETPSADKTKPLFNKAVLEIDKAKRKCSNVGLLNPAKTKGVSDIRVSRIKDNLRKRSFGSLVENTEATTSKITIAPIQNLETLPKTVSPTKTNAPPNPAETTCHVPTKSSLTLLKETVPSTIKFVKPIVNTNKNAPLSSKESESEPHILSSFKPKKIYSAKTGIHEKSDGPSGAQNVAKDAPPLKKSLPKELTHSPQGNIGRPESKLLSESPPAVSASATKTKSPIAKSAQSKGGASARKTIQLIKGPTKSTMKKLGKPDPKGVTRMAAVPLGKVKSSKTVRKAPVLDKVVKEVARITNLEVGAIEKKKPLLAAAGCALSETENQSVERSDHSDDETHSRGHSIQWSTSVDQSSIGSSGKNSVKTARTVKKNVSINAAQARCFQGSGSHSSVTTENDSTPPRRHYREPKRESRMIITAINSFPGVYRQRTIARSIR